MLGFRPFYRQSLLNIDENDNWQNKYCFYRYLPLIIDICPEKEKSLLLLIDYKKLYLFFQLSLNNDNLYWYLMIIDDKKTRYCI